MKDRRAVRTRQCALTEDQHRPLRVLQHLRKCVRAGSDVRENARARPQLLDRIGQIMGLPDIGDS